MKVICIDGTKPGTRGILYNISLGNEDQIYEGETYTVIESGEEQGYKFFRLKEKFHRYKQSRFAPISDIDETEFVRNYNKELV